MAEKMSETKKFFKSDTEVRNLSSRDKLDEYLDFREENDVWVEPYIDECAVVGLENNPLAINDFANREDCESSEDDLRSCAANMGWFLNFPYQDKMMVYPVLYTGIDSVCKRAGLSGRSIRNTREKKQIKVLSPVRKAAMISECFGLYSAKCKILIRDGKIPYMGSAQYLPLSAKRGIETLEESLAEDHPDVRYSAGIVSHEYLSCEYNLNDAGMVESMKMALNNAGIKVKTLSVGARFVTSDIGSSAMRVSAFITVNGVKATIGKPVGIRHDVSAPKKEDSSYQYVGSLVEEEEAKTETVQEKSFAKFKEQVARLAASFKECEDQVEELGNTIINHPAGCFQHIVLANKIFPLTTAKEVAADLENAYPGCASAIDIFFALNDMIEQANQTKAMTPTQYITMTEAAAETLFMDYSVYDEPLGAWTRKKA